MFVKFTPSVELDSPRRMSVKLSVEIKVKPEGPGVNKIRVMSGKLKSKE